MFTSGRDARRVSGSSDDFKSSRKAPTAPKYPYTHTPLSISVYCDVIFRKLDQMSLKLRPFWHHISSIINNKYAAHTALTGLLWAWPVHPVSHFWWEKLAAKLYAAAHGFFKILLYFNISIKTWLVDMRPIHAKLCISFASRLAAQANFCYVHSDINDSAML